MSKYSKSYIKEELQNFSQKELKAFKRLIQEFGYPIERAFEKVLEHRKKLLQDQEEEIKDKDIEKKDISQEKTVKENSTTSQVIGKNDGGQNIIKPVDPEEFELIGYKEEITPPPPQKRAKDLANEEIIPVLDPKEKELETLSKKEREVYEQFISAGRSHEDALKEAYREEKRELSQKLQNLEAFYGVKE